jgi:Flp pilus assembly protein TadB
MDTKKTKTKEQKDIIALAENTKYYNELLIDQCDSWLPEAEGMKNLQESKKNKQPGKKSRKKWLFFILPIAILILFA